MDNGLDGNIPVGSNEQGLHLGFTDGFTLKIGNGPQAPTDNIPIEAGSRRQAFDTPQKFPVSQSDRSMIYNSFEQIRWELSSKLVSHLERCRFNDEDAKYQEINRFFSELSRGWDQVMRDHGRSGSCNAVTTPDLQLEQSGGNSSKSLFEFDSKLGWL